MSSPQDNQKTEVTSSKDWNPWGFELFGKKPKEELLERPHETWLSMALLPEKNLEPKEGDKVVEIWGKAAIGHYLWEHVFQGKLNGKVQDGISSDALRFQNIILRFLTGPGLNQNTVHSNVENVIIVLNGRDPSKLDIATSWLTHLARLPRLQNAGVLLLGNEQCDNRWLHRFMHLNGGPVKFAFIVYDSPEIDEQNFFQWPLGVATYRDFPVVKKSDIEVDIEREYTCNFLGTIYENSTRETLLRLFTAEKLDKNHCYVKPRMEWLPKETAETQEDYIHSLAQSDLTLNPVGMNTECYRIYEAVAFGSVPVVEDQMTPGICSQNGTQENLYTKGNPSPLRLLKKYGAPFIYIKNWAELPEIIKKEEEMTLEQVIDRRKNMLTWYESFKTKMKERFVSVIQRKFFGQIT